MDKHYTDLAQKLSKTKQIGQNGRNYESLINSTMSQFASYLDENRLDFSPEIFSSWLIEKVPFPTEDQFYDVACLMDLIVANVDCDLNVDHFLNLRKASKYDFLPQWGKDLLHEYCFYLLLSGLYQQEKRNKGASFIMFLIENGYDNGGIVDCRATSSYYLACKKSIGGIREFIKFLYTLGLATYFAIDAYNPYFGSRVRSFDEVSLEDCEDEFTIEEYIEASKKLITGRQKLGYSVSALYDNDIALAEFGIFLELHNKGFSLKAVDKFLDVEEHEIGIVAKIRRRTLHEINAILHGKTLSEVPRVYRSVKNTMPSWSKASFKAYRELRIKNRMTESTLCMDYSSIMKFCNYLDNIGIKSFNEVNLQHIKDFNLQDKHTTAEGKAAYNNRVRGFLKFLYEEEIIAEDLSRSVPFVSAVRVKPPVILTDEEEAKLNDYLDTTTSLLDKALLKIASQTGMRSTDIVNLTFDSIDWNEQVFRIVQQKTRVENIIPFTTGVGNALYKYITEERPNVKSEFIFITPKAPYTPYTRNVISSALGRALGHGKGAHILRKTLASKMTESSSEFSIVTEALGHTTDATLDPYISIDEKRLKECALPLGETFMYKGGLM